MIILGIETSCDETAIAVLTVKGLARGTGRRKSKVESFKVLSNVVSSQVKLHAKFGGVVPNLAAREHEKNLPRVFRSALKEANLSQKSRQRNGQAKIKGQRLPVDLIAVTRGPGLSPALWRGINFAKELSEKYKKPIIGVNHLEGHIYSNFLPKIGEFSIFPDGKTIEDPRQSRDNFSAKGGSASSGQFSKKIFPILNLIVSGGHTELVLMEGHGKYKIIGETLDDAVGEAFDKVARLLGLGYPGGPQIARRAQKWKTQNTEHKAPRTNPLARVLRGRQIKHKTQSTNIEFPRPMINSKNYNFSYSGLKTAVLYKVRDMKAVGVKMADKVINEICYEFQNASLDVLIYKTIKAAQEHRVKSIFLSGGVSANTLLRSDLNKAAQGLGVNYSQPEMEYTGDNAAMIAVAGYFNYSKNKKIKTAYDAVEVDANLGF